MAKRFYAHTKKNAPKNDWQLLEDHLHGVAKLAASFAKTFGAEPWGWLAGLWHDLGKYQQAFQQRLQGDSRKVDHSVIGAVHAQHRGQHLLPLALVISGHHGGLPDLSCSEPGAPRPLAERLQAGDPLYQAVRDTLPTDLTEVQLPQQPAMLCPASDQRAEQLRAARASELWIRFLYSCLVDADFLDTEEFIEPGKRGQATAGMLSIRELRDLLDHHLDELLARAKPTTVNQLRAQVLVACRGCASATPGIYSLTVPTGGGKTLSAMAYALAHAVHHGKERVIVAIPYTSIVEQNAAVYREVFGASNLIEHHSNLDPDDESLRNRLASENWDAPIIVTTNVQLFESLFANRSSRCRKLHNLANSVILLDEPQSLPSKYLHAILDVIGELHRSYGCTVVLSTATQPAFRRRESLPIGFANIAEIGPEPSRLFDQLRRVEVDWQRLTQTEVSWDVLADELLEHEQVLVVVHKRDDARSLAELLPEHGRYHLSALMCAQHRKIVIDQVREALKNGEPCRLVSTQLIEAGVDVDFPRVYRALGGLDSIAQAAGRCNREGRDERGQVILFRAPTTPPKGTPEKGLQVTETMLAENDGTVDICQPEVFERYFRGLYNLEDLDAKQVQSDRQKLAFASVAAKVRLIEDGYTQPVVVPYGDSDQRLDELRRQGPSRDRRRALQPYLVNIYNYHLPELERVGALEAIEPSDQPVAWTLTQPYRHLYHQEFGLVISDEVQADPEAYIQ